MNKILNHRQTLALIKAIGPQRTVLVQGEAGAGKTTLYYDMLVDPALSHYHAMSAPIDCTQLSDGSVWMPDIDRSRGVSRELPNERFGVSDESHDGVEGAKPVIIGLDEIAKCRQAIKDTIAPIIYERRLGSNKLPKGSIVVAFTNLSEEGLGDSLQAHLRQRLFIVTMRKPTKDEWVQDFAIPHKLHPVIIAAVEQYPMVFESFVDYRPGGGKSGQALKKVNPYIHDPSNPAQEACVSPRTLHFASDMLFKRGVVDDYTLEAALDGVVGAPFSAHIMATMRYGDQNPPFEVVVADPDNAPAATNPIAQMVQVGQFITQTSTREQAEAVCTYVLRMRDELRSMFTARVADLIGSVPAFATSAKFAKLLAENRKFMGA